LEDFPWSPPMYIRELHNNLVDFWTFNSMHFCCDHQNYKYAFSPHFYYFDEHQGDKDNSQSRANEALVSSSSTNYDPPFVNELQVSHRCPFPQFCRFRICCCIFIFLNWPPHTSHDSSLLLVQRPYLPRSWYHVESILTDLGLTQHYFTWSFWSCTCHKCNRKTLRPN